MPFDFGAVYDGLSGGLNAGYGLMAKRRALMEGARVQAAQRALATGQINAANGNMPQNVPMPGATPMPGGGGPPGGPGAPPMSLMHATPHPRGPNITGAPPGPGFTAPMQGGDPASSPGTPAAAGPSAQPPAFSGVAASTGDVFQDGQQTVSRIFQELIKQNPELKKDPQLLFTAAEQQIGLLKGVNSDLKTAMQMQLGTQKLQYNYDSLASRTAKWQQESLDRAARLEELSRDKSLDRASRERIAAEAAAIRVQVAGMNDATRVDVANIGLEGRREGFDAAGERTAASLAERGREADNRDQVNERRSEIGSAGMDPKKPVARAKIRAQAPTQLPRRGQAPGGGPVRNSGAAYKSLADLQAAHRAGKVSASEAQRIAVQNGWAQ